MPAGAEAECETECAAGEHRCAFDGAPAERVCGPTGLWMPEAVCATGTSCRLAGDVARGCVACVGARAGAGNSFGASDGRCGADGGVESCGDDDQWTAATPCAATTACETVSRGVSTLAACAAP